MPVVSCIIFCAVQIAEISTHTLVCYLPETPSKGYHMPEASLAHVEGRAALYVCVARLDNNADVFLEIDQGEPTLLYLLQSGVSIKNLLELPCYVRYKSQKMPNILSSFVTSTYSFRIKIFFSFMFLLFCFQLTFLCVLLSLEVCCSLSIFMPRQIGSLL